MKENNKNKKRLLVALLMLVISAIALTSASYAWFSANKVVTTTGIDVKVTAATGISISADALDFGKTISMNDVIEFAKDDTDAFDSSLQLPEKLNPVSTGGIDGANTNFTFVRGELGENEEVVSYQDSTLSNEFIDATNYTSGDYITFDVYIKASQDLNLKLSNTSINALQESAGTGKLETGLRIGFLPLGNSTDNTVETQQSSAVSLNTVQSDWKIWNPYPAEHHAASLNGYSEGESEEDNGYYGAKEVTTNVEGLNTKGETATEEEISKNANHYVKYLNKDITVVPSYLVKLDNDNSNYVAGTSPTSTIFAVKAGINKVRVYIWLEGNDVDCVDAISISNGLKIDLGFEVNE